MTRAQKLLHGHPLEDDRRTGDFFGIPKYQRDAVTPGGAKVASEKPGKFLEISGMTKSHFEYFWGLEMQEQSSQPSYWSPPPSSFSRYLHPHLHAHPI